MMKLTPSGSQTVGPFFRIGLDHLCATETEPHEKLETITVFGRVFDGDGLAVPDAVLEFWHANAHGTFSGDPGESGRPVCFTRVATDEDGAFRFTIAMPGAVVCESELGQSPHLAVLVFARGLMRHLITRMYLPDEAANASDALLQMVPVDRRHTLIARADGSNASMFEWNVVLQGTDETVFFAW
jgi:protocatechuate 3,4-dioxygenase, alpha subunit